MKGLEVLQKSNHLPAMRFDYPFEWIVGVQNYVEFVHWPLYLHLG